MLRKPEPAQLRSLGIEGGGTRTVALLADGRGQPLRRLETGPANIKLLTGSTRLKAGTATKLLLNMFTTLAMVRIGKVRSNLMIDLNPANVKLRDRAVQIVRALTGTDYAAAQGTLEHSGWVIKKAVARPSWK